MTKVSVVIPAYNEEKSIGKILESLKGQDCEVIVVDDDSTDRTVEIAKSYSCKILRSGRHHTPYSRNIGMAAAKGDIIINLDASEMTVPKDFISKVKECFKDCDGLLVKDRFTKRTLVNKLAWLRTFSKPEYEYNTTVRIFKKGIKYGEHVYWGEDRTIKRQIKKLKKCNKTYIQFDYYPIWSEVIKAWKKNGIKTRRERFGLRKLKNMFIPLFFGLTSPLVMLHRLLKFRKWECLLIPVYDTVRTLSFIYGLLTYRK